MENGGMEGFARRGYCVCGLAGEKERGGKGICCCGQLGQAGMGSHDETRFEFEGL